MKDIRIIECPHCNEEITIMFELELECDTLVVLSLDKGTCPHCGVTLVGYASYDLYLEYEEQSLTDAAKQVIKGLMYYDLNGTWHECTTMEQLTDSLQESRKAAWDESRDDAYKLYGMFLDMIK